MKKLLISSFIVTVCCAVLSSGVYAKPKPPAELTKIFEEFDELEEALEEEKWGSVSQDLEEISGEFKKVFPVLKEHVGKEVIGSFVSLMGSLKKSIESKNEETSLKNYILLKKLFVNLMEPFEYKINPILQVIFEDIAEAEEGLEEKEWDEVTGEMEEVIMWQDLGALKTLKEKGASDEELNDFTAKIKEVLEAANAEDAGRAETAMGKLKDITAKFKTLF